MDYKSIYEYYWMRPGERALESTGFPGDGGCGFHGAIAGLWVLVMGPFHFCEPAGALCRTTMRSAKHLIPLASLVGRIKYDQFHDISG